MVVFPCGLWERAARADDGEGARYGTRGRGSDAANRIDYHLRLKFGKQNYVAIELRRGEEAAEVANKLRELAAQVEAL